MTMRTAILVVLLLLGAGETSAAPPVISDDRLVIELAAREPDIVTPTGLAVDELGRVWAIENNTHQRQANYKGFDSDRIKIFGDPGPDGNFRKVTTFADGFKHSMGLALGRNGDVYLATRSDIWRLRDPKNEGKATERKVIVKLDTPGDYPHNGLSGFAFDGQGNMYFALGENLGASYKLIGSDGTVLSGGGEGGSIYRCRPNGSKLERVATGFWNTFHQTFDAFGRLFAVDNDPDSRGPCRLLHIVEGGDYGYRFRNGRRGLHPFTAWNGELPGTLPMTAGTAEAPSGILAYDSNGLPTEYRDKLLVTSWGDHVVEKFTLTPRGASFGATSTVLVRGGDDFRPVGIATAPDGSIYLSDWVDKSYPVHGKGRLWRIRMKEPPKDDGLRPSKLAALDVEHLGKLLGDPRGDIRRAAVDALAANGAEGGKILIAAMKENADVRKRVAVLQGIARLDPAIARQPLSAALDDGAPEVRGEAARLVGPMLCPEEPLAVQKLTSVATSDKSPFVRMQAISQLLGERSLKTIVPVLRDADPFLASAALAALDRSGASDLLLPSLNSKDARMRLGALLVMRRAGKDPGKHDMLRKFLADPDPGVRRAAIQWVAEQRLRDYRDSIDESAAKEPVTRDLFEALLAAKTMLASDPGKPLPESSGEEHIARIVKDPKQPVVFRSFGLRMLRPDHLVITSELLTALLASPERSLSREAVRTLAARSDAASQQMLRTLSSNKDADAQSRAFAVLGLAHSASDSPETRKLLMSFLADSTLQRDALRSLRGVALSGEERNGFVDWWGQLEKKNPPVEEQRELAEQLLLTLGTAGEKDEFRKKLESLIGPAPANEQSWRKALSDKGDPEAGERVFHHIRGARCAVCHRIDGRGGQVGPELSVIAGSHNRDKLIESILTPSKEIAPAFTTWTVVMYNGKSHTGVIVGEGFDSTLTLADAEGKRIVLKKLDIESRQASPKSLMPDDLHRQMTRREFRDLLEYLGARKP